MITKEHAQKLLRSKWLHGEEAGRLFIQDSYLVDRGLPGILTEKEIKSIKSLVRLPGDIEVYNSYVEAYRLIGYSLREATRLNLEIQNTLYYVSLCMKEYLDRGSGSRKRHDAIQDKPRLDILHVIYTDHLKKFISRLLAYKKVMEKVSRYVGVDISSEIVRSLEIVEGEALRIHNFYAEDPDISYEKIRLDKIKPDKAIEKELIERMSRAFGAGWSKAEIKEARDD